MNEHPDLKIILMQYEGLSADEIQELLDTAAEVSAYNRRLELIQPYLMNLVRAPIGLQKCIKLAQKELGSSVGVTVDVIDIWLQCGKDVKATLNKLGLAE